MPDLFAHIRTPIQEAFPDVTVYVRDPRRDGIHIEVLVISPVFEGLSLVEQHRKVMVLFKEALQKDVLHALGLHTFTPAKWELRKDSYSDLL